MPKGVFSNISDSNNDYNHNNYNLAINEIRNESEDIINDKIYKFQHKILNILNDKHNNKDIITQNNKSNNPLSNLDYGTTCIGLESYFKGEFVAKYKRSKDNNSKDIGSYILVKNSKKLTNNLSFSNKSSSEI